MSSKWKPVYPRKKKPKERAPDPLDELCRVVPPVLARIPDVMDWLLLGRKVKVSNLVAQDLKARYREINDMIRNSKISLEEDQNF